MQGLQRRAGVDAEPVGEVARGAARSAPARPARRARRRSTRSRAATEASSSSRVAASSGSASSWSPSPDRARPSTAAAISRCRAAVSRSSPSGPSAALPGAGSASATRARSRARTRSWRPSASRAPTTASRSASASTAVGSQPEPVAVVGAGDHLGRGLRAGPRDHDLQRLRRVGGYVVRSPDLVDQPLLADLAARRRPAPPAARGCGRPAAGCPARTPRRAAAGPQESALDCPAPLGGKGDRGVASGARLLLGQRAVGGAEPQREGQRLVAGLDLVAGVDVEEPDRLEVLPRALAQGRLDLRRWSRRRPRPGRRPPWRPGRSRRPGPAPRRPRAPSGSRGRSRRPRSGPAARTPRTRAGAARRRGRTRPRPRWTWAQRPGCHGIRLAEATSTSTPSSSPSLRTSPIASDQPAARPAPHQPARSRSPASTTARCSGCSGIASNSLASSVVGRPPVDAVDRRRAAVDGERHRAGLEQRDARGAAAEVAGRARGAGRAAASWCTTAPRPRAGWPAGPRARSGSSAGSPSWSKAALADEREADHLDAAGAGQGAADPPAQPLLAGEPAAGGLAGQHRRDLVVADDPDDLLDQVVGVGEVGAPGRRGAQYRRAVPDQAADLLEVGDRGRRRGCRCRRCGPGRSEAIAMAAGRGASPTTVTPGSAVPPPYWTSSSTTRSAAAGVITGSTPRSLRLPASEVSLCRLPVRNMDTGVPVRRLDQHARRGRGHLGGLAAHHAAEADDPGVVGDHQVLGRERAVDAVEGGQPLALAGAADADRALRACRRRSRGWAGRARASRSW